MGRVVVVGLGPAGFDLVTAGALDAIARTGRRWLRTERHPAAPVVPDAATFDEVYERAASLDEVYAEIADRLVAEAALHGEVLYAVPGSPAVAERTVELLRERAAAGDIELEVLPALSFLDLAWARLGVDPVATGVRVVDGHRFAVEAAGERGPLLVAQCDSRQVLSDVKLSVDEGPDEAVTVLQRLGLPDESVRRVAWADLDREIEPDHLTSLWIPHLAAPVGAELVRFEELVRTLREQCPWDREQTHDSLRRHLIEEAYEALEAIEQLDPDDPSRIAHLEEELGDVLFQVYFHATLAAEEGWFTLADVARGIHDKLVHRHPHVFGDVEADTAGQVLANWEDIKRAEKGRSSVMDGLPHALPALMLAAKVQKKAASAGFDWPDVEGPYAKVTEELGEVRDDPSSEAELGDLLFACVNVARHLGHDPEAALRLATRTFEQRFRDVERLAAERGIDLAGAGLDALDRLWDEIKTRGQQGSRPASGGPWIAGSSPV